MRQQRKRRLPARYRDQLPEAPLAVRPDPPDPASTSSILPRVILHVFDSLRTAFNKFGIAREYHHRPSYDPEQSVPIEELANFGNGNNTAVDSGTSHQSAPWPWSNMSVWRMMAWLLSGSGEKSGSEMNRLVDGVLLASDFDLKDLSGFNAETAMRKLDKAEGELASDPTNSFNWDGWKTNVGVDIRVPSREKCAEGNERRFTIHGLAFRPLVPIIRSVFKAAAAKWFHFTPFKHIWKSPVTGQEQRLYDELYTSNAWNEAHDDIQKQRRNDGCKLERVVAGLMFWSDSTHLAQFGHAKAWPIYLFFGNLSKYRRASVSGACHPIAFIPSVSFTIFA